MDTKTWTFVDRSAWGPGPWQEEPADKMQWVDAATGLPCLAVRGPFGAWCGYVGMTPDHPLYGVDYNACARRPMPCAKPWGCGHTPEDLLEVHGGLTFSGECREAQDDHGICHIVAPGEETQVWWFGFDTAHSQDYAPGLMASFGAAHLPRQYYNIHNYKSLAYVRGACADLAAQLAMGDRFRIRSE